MESSVFDKLIKRDKKDKKSKKAELPPIDPTVSALQQMASLVDQVNALYRNEHWPRSHRLWWDFSVRPPRLTIQRYSYASAETVYPVADLSVEAIRRL